MAKANERRANQLRPVQIKTKVIKHADGSCLISFGDTQVICTAMVEENVPPFLKGTGQGWVTAEYGMLPGSCPTRVRRDKTSGRMQEIQRLIGRSLRAVVDMKALGERTVKIDCDVIQADGGTRTASITGGFVALSLALNEILRKRVIPCLPLKDYVAAVSVGMLEGKVILDLNYEQDSSADVDMNVVMVGKGAFVEVQGTAEGKPFSQADMDKMMALARKGIKELVGIQKETLKGIIL